MSDPTMEIHVNGDPVTVNEPMTVAGLLQFLKIPLRHVAVEQNRQIVPKSDYETAPVTPGDQFEIVTLVGGG